MKRPSTETADYKDRLVRESGVWWKRWLDVQRPYRWNLQRLEPGRTLDVGCGIGRNLAALSRTSVGVDHNVDSVAEAKRRGFDALSSEELSQRRNELLGQFDSLLFSHLLEHLDPVSAQELVASYLPYLRAAGGKTIFITPQEAGYRSDATHVEFVDFVSLSRLCDELGLQMQRQFSFPFPRIAGRYFKYNEFVVVATPRLRQP